MTKKKFGFGTLNKTTKNITQTAVYEETPIKKEVKEAIASNDDLEETKKSDTKKPSQVSEEKTAEAKLSNKTEITNQPKPIPEEKETKTKLAKGRVAQTTTRERGKKIGRPSNKKSDVKYVRLSVDVPIETRDRLKIALYTKIKNKYLSQDEMINDIIEQFLQKHSL